MAVYCKNNFTFKRQFTVPGLNQGDIVVMTSCAKLDCLLLADHYRRCLYEVVEDDKNSSDTGKIK